MTVDELIEYYGGNSKAAKALGIKPQHISNWRARGHIPEGQQYKIEQLTQGKLLVSTNEAIDGCDNRVEHETKRLLKLLGKDGYLLSLNDCKKIVLRKFGMIK